jgi:hypothetical protein
MVTLLGKPLLDGNATPSVKSWLRQGHHKADDNRIRKKVKPEYLQHQMAVWSLL